MAARTEFEELDIAQQILSAVFASTPDGLVVLDESLVILQANPTFCGWVGRNHSDVVGQFIGDVLVCEQLVPALHRLTTNNLASTEIEFITTVPVRRSLLAHIARLNAGRLNGWIVALHDQSERKRLEYQKMEFINIAAHELRTPLMAVIGFANLLARGLQGQLDSRHQEFLTSIVDGGRQLKLIVDEMLQFAHLEEGYLEEDVDSVGSLYVLINEIVLGLQQRAKDKRVVIKVDVDPTIVVQQGIQLLRTALNQILLNAINFNRPDGSVRIVARQQDDEISIEVVDTGIGIATADLELIFQPFAQVEDHYIRQVGGLGLGLSIAKRAIAQLEGTLSVDSTLGSGTTFVLRFPANRTALNSELAALQAQLKATKQQTREYARDIQSLYSQLQKHSLATLASITEALETRDVYFRNHTERVTELALKIAQHLGYSELYLGTLETACRIHDIGKIGIPDAIINKAGALTEEEEQIMRQHVTLGRRILEPLTFLKDALPIAFSHHEHWDGSGYPNGMKGEEIPFGGRIIAVADAYDAMVSPRSYREALSQEKALEILQAGAGSQWDPKVVEALMTVLQKTPSKVEQL
jgi:PAS domain S-box